MPSSQTKKAANLSFDPALLQEARGLGINLSQAAEAGLRQARARGQNAEQWKRENAKALESSNQWARERGLPLERYRQY